MEQDRRWVERKWQWEQTRTHSKEILMEMQGQGLGEYGSTIETMQTHREELETTITTETVTPREALEYLTHTNNTEAQKPSMEERMEYMKTRGKQEHHLRQK